MASNRRSSANRGVKRPVLFPIGHFLAIRGLNQPSAPAHPLHRLLGGDDDEESAGAAQAAIEQRRLLPCRQVVDRGENHHLPLEPLEAADRLEQHFRGLRRLVRRGLEGADALAIVTDWNQFRNPDFGRVRRLLSAPIIFDGRNLYDPDAVAGMGFAYFSIGRAPARPALGAGIRPGKSL